MSGNLKSEFESNKSALNNANPDSRLSDDTITTLLLYSILTEIRLLKKYITPVQPTPVTDTGVTGVGGKKTTKRSSSVRKAKETN